MHFYLKKFYKLKKNIKNISFKERCFPQIVSMKFCCKDESICVVNKCFYANCGIANMLTTAYVTTKIMGYE